MVSFFGYLSQSKKRSEIKPPLIDFHYQTQIKSSLDFHTNKYIPEQIIFIKPQKR